MDFLTLSKNLKKDYSLFPEYRIAFISDVATQLVAKALRAHAYDLKINLAVFEAGLGQGESEILNPDSEFNRFKPKAVFIYHAFALLQTQFFSSKEDEKKHFAEAFLDKIKRQISLLEGQNLQGIFLGTFPEVPDAVPGINALSGQVREINKGIYDLCQKNEICSVYPVHSFITTMGYDGFYDPQLYYSSFSDISFKALPEFAAFTLQRITSYTGSVKKCIILDLDNTLWGGIAGDDGWENLEIGNLGKGKVFTDFQYWLKELRRQGILLVICSKNEEKIAREVFEKHPEMVLKLEDFAMFVANWTSKADNVRHIIEALNIGADSIVFLDDNAAEREQVRQVFPEMAVPDLPADASAWLLFLTKCNFFNFESQTSEDLDKTAKYQSLAARKELSALAPDRESYLRSLQMEARVEPINDFNIPRLAQLTQKTNQFNLRTVRYSESDLRKFMNSSHYTGYAISLRDKFGDEGIVSFLLLEKQENEIFIDTWVMSCRVFGRDLENLVFNILLEEAKKQLLNIKAQYIPTAKNKYVGQILPDLGFSNEGEYFILKPEKAFPKQHFIAY